MIIAAETYDILVSYEDGVLSVSKWLVIIVIGCVLAFCFRTK